MIRNPCERFSQISLGLNSVELGCANQTVHLCRTFTAGFGVGKQKVFAPQCHRTQRVLSGIVVNLRTAVQDERVLCIPLVQRVLNRTSEW